MVIPTNRTVLHVSGFSSRLRARDLAYEFERYGRLIRCDVPALKHPNAIPYAFVEFRREDDAEDAYYDMHGRSIDGRRISVEWAKRPPSSSWRHDGAPPPPRYDSRDYRGGYDDRRNGGPPRDTRYPSLPRSVREDPRGRSPSPRAARGRSRSPSPARDRRTPSPVGRDPEAANDAFRNGDKEGEDRRGSISPVRDRKQEEGSRARAD